jgi:hypothetical protein
MDFPFGDRNTRLLSTDIRESHSRRCRVLNELLLNYTVATAALGMKRSVGSLNRVLNFALGLW